MAITREKVERIEKGLDSTSNEIWLARALLSAWDALKEIDSVHPMTYHTGKGTEYNRMAGHLQAIARRALPSKNGR